MTDQSLGYLFAAFFAAWLVVILYLVVLSGRLSALRREVEALRREAEETAGRRPRGGSTPLSS